MSAGGEVFRPDLGLRVRMWIALVLSALLLAALIAIAGWLIVAVDNGWSIVVAFAFVAFVGASHESRRSNRRAPPLRPELARRAKRAVSRLAVVADMTEPETVVVLDAAPLSWTTALPRRRPRVHVTTALLGRLREGELDAVVAHELSHVVQRDAVLMTVLSAPGVFVLRGLRATWNEPGSGLRAKFGVLLYFCLMGPPAIVSAGLCRIVSRHRELAADHGAALLTGSPAALAAALRRLSEGLHAIPDKDLRVAAASDVLHVVPAKPASGVARLWATHPPLEDRIRRLERLEARLQA